MSDKMLIELTDTNGNGTTVLVDDGWFSDTWNQTLLGPAMLIGSGSGSFTHLGAARRLNLWDGQNNRQLVSMNGVSRLPMRRGDSGEGLCNGPSPVLSTGPITWTCLYSY